MNVDIAKEIADILEAKKHVYKACLKIPAFDDLHTKLEEVDNLLEQYIKEYE